MGVDLQESRNNRSRHRPGGALQCDLGVKHSELPLGQRQAEAYVRSFLRLLGGNAAIVGPGGSLDLRQNLPVILIVANEKK